MTKHRRRVCGRPFSSRHTCFLLAGSRARGGRAVEPGYPACATSSVSGHTALHPRTVGTALGASLRCRSTQANRLALDLGEVLPLTEAAGPSADGRSRVEASRGQPTSADGRGFVHVWNFMHAVALGADRVCTDVRGHVVRDNRFGRMMFVSMHCLLELRHRDCNWVRILNLRIDVPICL